MVRRSQRLLCLRRGVGGKQQKYKVVHEFTREKKELTVNAIEPANDHNLCQNVLGWSPQENTQKASRGGGGCHPAVLDLSHNTCYPGPKSP